MDEIHTEQQSSTNFVQRCQHPGLLMAIEIMKTSELQEPPNKELQSSPLHDQRAPLLLRGRTFTCFRERGKKNYKNMDETFLKQ